MTNIRIPQIGEHVNIGELKGLTFIGRITGVREYDTKQETFSIRLALPVLTSLKSGDSILEYFSCWVQFDKVKGWTLFSNLHVQDATANVKT